MKEYVIIMADIINSRDENQAALMLAFKKLVSDVNESRKDILVSPLTITLGDEFQGVMDRIEDAVKVIFDLEEAIIKNGSDFKLRYVVVEGLIETPINKEIAYGMLGDGLTRARKYLENLKKEDLRFFFWLKDQQQKNALINVFTAFQDIVDDWNPERDFYLVTAFLAFGDYKRVAMELQKERSLMWKRKKNLKINAYFALKEVANYIGGTHA
ncbi:SatD family protein [Mucilaginibacter glaciei]|uniref:SatD family protein n=1 Tax=Mucilaginibacter glaciei TaxID=2772109 RepID=A0A926NN42_9SPHI|nr:SatD family protein [Mucilaginibacter glaciei]MBD1395129.1 hypothetical protein [Mucilaginibacter glaciei]